MVIGEPKFEMKQPTEFRELVESLVEGSGLFKDWVNPTNPDEKMSVLDAIEKNELSLYMGERASEQKIDAVRCLTAIYDELKKSGPDSDFIEQTVERLKEYL